MNYGEMASLAIANADRETIKKQGYIKQCLDIVCGGEFSTRIDVLTKLAEFGFEQIELYPTDRITIWKRGKLILNVQEDFDGKKYFVEPGVEGK